MDLPHSSDLDAQRRFEDAEYEERLRNTESGLSYSVLPDNVQHQEEHYAMVTLS